MPAIVRVWIYAIHGISYEMMFTAMFNFANTKDSKLMGESSVWSLWVYGVGGLVCELLLIRNANFTKLHWVLRALSYVVFTYLWEYSHGFVLRLFGACPWDYEMRRWNLHGLITLEYAPAWFAVSLVHERVSKMLLNVNWEKVKTV